MVYQQPMSEIMGPEGRMRMPHFGLAEYTSGGHQITNYSSPSCVKLKLRYQVPGEREVIVTVKQNGFDVLEGSQRVTHVRYDSKVEKQLILELSDGDYLVPTISK